MQVSESILRSTFRDIIHGESSLREKEVSLNKQSISSYKFPISIIVEELKDTIEKSPEYAVQYSELIVDELIKDIKLNYAKYIKLI